MLNSWPEPEPQAIPSVSPRDQAAGGEATGARVREDDPAPSEPRAGERPENGERAVTGAEPDYAGADGEWDNLDWICGR